MDGEDVLETVGGANTRVPLDCSVSGVPEPKIEWTRDGKVLRKEELVRTFPFFKKKIFWVKSQYFQGGSARATRLQTGGEPAGSREGRRRVQVRRLKSGEDEERLWMKHSTDLHCPSFRYN